MGGIRIVISPKGSLRFDTLIISKKREILSLRDSHVVLLTNSYMDRTPPQQSVAQQNDNANNSISVSFKNLKFEIINFICVV